MTEGVAVVLVVVAASAGAAGWDGSGVKADCVMMWCGVLCVVLLPPPRDSLLQLRMQLLLKIVAFTFVIINLLAAGLLI